MNNLLKNIGKKSKKAYSIQLNTKKKNKVLKDYCLLIEKNKKLILNQNLKDINNAYKKKLKDNLIKRLILDNKKILNIVDSIKNTNFLSTLFFTFVVILLTIAFLAFLPIMFIYLLILNFYHIIFMNYFRF